MLSGQSLSDRQQAIKRREDAKATMGNLNLLHYGVNRSLQHQEFAVKREKLFAETNLHLNRSLLLLKKWDETEIVSRDRLSLKLPLSFGAGLKKSLSAIN